VFLHFGEIKRAYMRFTYLFLFIFLFGSSIFAQQEVEFITTVSKNKMGANERLRVQFSINKQGGDNFTPPNFTRFRVVGGPSQSVSQSWVNGKVSFSQSYTYFVEPLQKGELTIPSATIEYRGKTLKTDPVKVIVVDGIEIPKDPNDPNYIAEQNIHLVAEISKSQPYVGEGIFVEYKLYVSPNISVNDYAVTETPQYIGFWNQDIEANGIPVKNGTYNGETYRYVVLKRALLIPTKSGKLTIDPMKMNIVIGVPTGRGDFFGNAITRNIRKDFSSAKKVIDVNPLPTEGKPLDFNGAVGNFSFVISADKDALKANETSQIKVEVSGDGNLKLFELPKIITPSELEIYEPERKERVTVSPSGISGKVSDQYTVVPLYKGKYKIPNVSFSYFNPQEKKYKTITTEDLFVDVLEGKELPTNTTIAEQNVVLTGENFRYIQTKTSFKPIRKDDFFKSNLFYLVLILPLIIIPIGILIAKKSEQKNRDIIGKKQRRADKLARKYLSKAQKELGKKESFYEALELALHNYLKAKLSIETIDISQEKISSILSGKNVDETTIQTFIEVLNSCDFARYTPTTNLEMKAEYEKAKLVIAQIDKQL